MQLTLSSTKIWVANQAVDFRRSIDGLLSIVLEQFSGEVPNDAVFVFYNRYRNKLKLLGWHRNGYVLLYKRLEQGRFTVQPSASGYIPISAEQCSWLVAGLDWVTLSDWSNDLIFESYH